ncbi:MAG: hypothetical protein HYU71_12420 [Bacteroidetes bacterium]|nr:hypothetical protein [Bacteroidota bacterium]
MEIGSIIKAHLYLNSERDENGKVSESSLVHALRNIRLITERDQDTGIATPNGYLGNWIGAIGYITILDQIGKCYRPTYKEIIKDTKISPIKKALFYFANLNEKEVDAIYALRNAFHHDFSLLNLDENKKRAKYIHHFQVNAHPTEYIVKLPLTQWDGDINNRNNGNATYVNLQALGDLVENVYAKLLTLESNGEIVLELAGGEAELKARYIFYH